MQRCWKICVILAWLGSSLVDPGSKTHVYVQSALFLCFVATDFFIGFHSTTLFTWGSVVLIGLISTYFNKGILTRLGGVFGGCCIFYLITNFGVWSLGSYGYSLDGLISCYILAIPFFGYTILSTIVYSVIIETIFKFYKTYYKNSLKF